MVPEHNAYVINLDCVVIITRLTKNWKMVKGRRRRGRGLTFSSFITSQLTPRTVET